MILFVAISLIIGLESSVQCQSIKTGRAILYAGANEHECAAIPSDGEVEGEQVSLVIWMHSSQWRKDYLYCDKDEPPMDSSYAYE